MVEIAPGTSRKRRKLITSAIEFVYYNPRNDTLCTCRITARVLLKIAKFSIEECIQPYNRKLMKGKALRKQSLHEKTTASVLLKLFISSNEWWIHYDCYFAPGSDKSRSHAAAHTNEALTSIVSPLFCFWLFWNTLLR